ncbi:MAG TPA: hypothetical protein VHX88_09555 [Solirubrobacteraceae bacterium]|nr:hypothetical protein [Solirubrobacteraceae bacterium]
MRGTAIALAAAVVAAILPAAAGADAIPQSVSAIAAGSDGAIWFADPPDVGRITPAGAISEFALKAPSTLSGLAAGPDGSEWLIGASDVLGRVTTAGTLTGGPLPLAPGESITAWSAGPGGSLYLGMSGGPSQPALERVTPAGAVQPIAPTVSAADDVADLAVGADGAVWFVASAPGSSVPYFLGHVTPAGVVKTVPAFAAGIGLLAASMAVDANGNLWMAVNPSGIARVSATGALRRFRRVADVDDVAAGPKGGAWFSGFDGTLKRITAAGAVSTVASGLPSPSSGQTPGLLAATGRALWLVEDGHGVGGHLARITPAGQVRYDPAGPGCRLPDVSDLPLAVAVTQLRNWCGAATRVRGRPRGVVRGEHPPGGSDVAFGVHVTLARGPAPTVTRCRAQGGVRVLARDPQLLVWTEKGRTFACAPPHGRAQTVLDSPAPSASLKVAGPVLGFVTQFSDQYTHDESLYVYDVDQRRFLLDAPVEAWPVDTPAASPGFGGYAIDAAGDVAWILENVGGGDHLVVQTASGEHTLDTAPSITAVAIAGGEVTWTADGQARSAPLTPSGPRGAMRAGAAR